MKAAITGSAVTVTLPLPEATGVRDELLWSMTASDPHCHRLWEILDALLDPEPAGRGPAPDLDTTPGMMRHRVGQIEQRITELGGRAAKDGLLASLLTTLQDEITGLEILCP
jgi:hypothetical protein